MHTFTREKGLVELSEGVVFNGQEFQKEVAFKLTYTYIVVPGGMFMYGLSQGVSCLD